jgi:hypothetical protein
MNKWTSGELKPITKAMVTAREKLAAQESDAVSAGSSSNGYDFDLEQGEMTDYQRERQLAHEEALAALNGLEPAYLAKVGFRGQGRDKGSGKAHQPPSPERPTTPALDGDRFFTIDAIDPDPVPDSHGPDAIPLRTFCYSPSIIINHASNSASSSRYSRATDSAVGRTTHGFGRTQEEHYIPSPLLPPPLPITLSDYRANIWGPRNAAHMRE